MPAGETVGYSRRGAIDKDSVIAAIPIGYADGLKSQTGQSQLLLPCKWQTEHTTLATFVWT